MSNAARNEELVQLATAKVQIARIEVPRWKSTQQFSRGMEDLHRGHAQVRNVKVSVGIDRQPIGFRLNARL